MGQAKRRREAGERVTHCRTCTYCCTLPQIEALAKPAYRPCSHIADGGCSIYGRPERPAACSAYACAYLTARLANAPERNRIPHPLDCGAYFHRDPVEKVIFLFVDPARPQLWKATALLVDFLKLQVSSGFVLVTDRGRQMVICVMLRRWVGTPARDFVAMADRERPLTFRASARVTRRRCEISWGAVKTLRPLKRPAHRMAARTASCIARFSTPRSTSGPIGRHPSAAQPLGSAPRRRRPCALQRVRSRSSRSRRRRHHCLPPERRGRVRLFALRPRAGRARRYRHDGPASSGDCESIGAFFRQRNLRALESGEPLFTLHRSAIAGQVHLWERLVLPRHDATGEPVIVIVAKPGLP